MRAEKKPMVRVVGRRGVEALLVLGPDRPGTWMLRSLAGGTLVAAASSAASFCLPLDGTVSGSIMLFVRGVLVETVGATTTRRLSPRVSCRVHSSIVLGGKRNSFS